MFTFISKDSEAEGLSKTLMDIKLTLENKQLETEKSPQVSSISNNRDKLMICFKIFPSHR